jgi:nitrite reductase/ring-hydroxylating ferredoxin subunit
LALQLDFAGTPPRGFIFPVAQQGERHLAWHLAARSSELKEGEVLGLNVNKIPIALYRIEGVVYATSNVCTHEFALLSDGYLDGDCIECPLHQALFHVPTGEVRCEPAEEPIQTYSVKEEGDNIHVLLPD